MQHIFQISIDIDDERIRNAIAESAEKEIIKKLTVDVEKILYNHSWGTPGENNRRGLSDFAEDKIDDFLEACREAIISEAAERLAGKLAKTKKGKEILNNLEA